MELIFHPHKDLMLEALQCLNLKEGDHSLEGVKARMELIFPREAGQPAFRERFSAVRALRDAVAREYTPSAEEAAFFLRPFSMGQGSLAECLLCSFHDPAVSPWPRQRAHILEKFRAFASDPAAALETLCLGLIGDDSPRDGQTPARPLWQQLEESGFTDAENWQLWKVIQDPEPYLDRLGSLLSPAAEAIGRHLDLVEPHLADFARRWQEYLQATSLAQYLQECIGMDPGDISHSTISIYPSVFDFGSMRLTMEDEAMGSPVLWYIGLCIPEGISVKARPMEDAGLTDGLKALSDKSKLSILKRIRDQGRYGQELARDLNLSTATISHHMAALISCGFIRLTKTENRIYYRMDKESLGEFLKRLSAYLIGEDDHNP